MKAHSYQFWAPVLLTLTLVSCGKKVTETSAPEVVVPSTQVGRGEFTGVPGKVSLWNRATGYDCAVFLPKSYRSESRKTYPVILSLHGYNGGVLNSAQTQVGGNKMGFIKQVWDTPLSETFEAIVIAPHVYPVGSTENMLWNHRELRDLIIEATLAFKVDPDRIVATGVSAGAIATQELLKHSRDLLAAGMVGAFQYLYQRDVCKFADTPVWVFGNSSDELFDASGWKRVRTEIEECPTYSHQFKLSVYQTSCEHGCWDEHWSNPAVQRWLVSQVR